LLTIRKKNKALQESASVLILPTHHPNVLAYLCRRQADRILVLINFCKQDAQFHFNHPAVAATYKNLFTGEEITIPREKSFHFQPGEYAVYHITQ